MRPDRTRRAGARLLRLPWSFRRQIVVLTVAVTAVAMLLLALVLQVVLSRITNNDVDRVLEDRAQSVISSARADSHGGTITVPDAILDPGVVVFDSSQEQVVGSTPRSLHEHYEALASTRVPVVEEARGPSRVRAQPFTLPDGTTGVVVVSERLDPYEEAESLALIVSLVTGLLASAAAGAIAAWTMRRVLRPVTEMAVTAEDWSEHDLSRRFALGPPTNEISTLAGTLDILLDKVSSAIRSEQRLTSELAHELRTPLTSIQGTADLMRMREGPALSTQAHEDLQEITSASRRMAETITTLLDLARTEATVAAAGLSNLTDVLDDVITHTSAGDLDLRVAVTDARLALPHALAVRTVSPVLDNALHFAHTTVELTSRHVEGGVELLISDDGPGVDPTAAVDIFEPGRTSGTSGGAGLGLALSRRVVRAAGGDVSLAETPPPSGGARFVILFPLA